MLSGFSLQSELYSLSEQKAGQLARPAEVDEASLERIGTKAYVLLLLSIALVGKSRKVGAVRNHFWQKYISPAAPVIPMCSISFGDRKSEGETRLTVKPAACSRPA
jgi:hypothetical protein